MMTLAIIETDADDGVPPVYVDLDDSGHFYLKQDDDWVALPVEKAQALVEALKSVWVK